MGVFKCLDEMVAEKKLHFIDVKNHLDSFNILEQYVREDYEIDKKEYV